MACMEVNRAGTVKVWKNTPSPFFQFHTGVEPGLL
jgi:hypothetical protein